MKKSTDVDVDPAMQELRARLAGFCANSNQHPFVPIRPFPVIAALEKDAHAGVAQEMSQAEKREARVMLARRT